MVDAIVSTLLEQLISFTAEEAKEQVRLVTGVGKEVGKLTSNLRSINDVLNDAEQKQFKEQSVRDWLDQLKDAAYDMEDVLDEWITARLKLQIEGVDKKKTVCSFFLSPCFGFKEVVLRRDIALKIKDINENLDDIAKDKQRFNFNVVTAEKSERIHSTALINVSEVRGRDKETNTLKSKLLECSKEKNAVQIISLVGMGGIGKTTLAQLAYNDEDVIKNFEKRIWVCVSDPFDEIRIAKAIIETLEGSTPNLGELNSLLLHIAASITRKRFLLVLDDVWTEERHKWEPFHNCLMNGLYGSKILVTTRNETVAKMMESTDIIPIKQLSQQECWLLFERFAFFGRPPMECEKLEDIGKEIVDKCKGLPLAAKTMGSMLRFKKTREEWQSVLDSEMWQLKEFEKGLLAPLILSYNDLPSKIKRCFSYCAIFPKDYDMKKDELIKLWMALGYIEPEENKDIEITGEEYFDCLASRSFFQEFRCDDRGNIVECKMHDIMHDFAQYLAKNECQCHSEEELLSLIHTSLDKLRHLRLSTYSHASFPVSIFEAKKLRSLLIDIYIDEDLLRVILPDLFGQLTCLRALRITCSRADIVLIEGMKKLIHLRYLKLRLFNIEEVSKICCELLNLQILDIGTPDFLSLKSLPQGIGKLVNLRHLIFDGYLLEYMPKGIERLTCLRTLSEFVVSPSGKYGSKACNLEGMKNLNHLRGCLTIRGLGNLTDVNEAKIAALEKKKNLLHLEIHFDARTTSTTEMMEENEANHEAIGEALGAPPNLERLAISKYKCKSVLPSWIMILKYLKALDLSFCNKFETMPPLGKLQSHEILNVYDMTSVKRVGDEFLGIEGDHITGTSTSVIAFPKLKELKFIVLEEWEEWNFAKENIAIMPQLNFLRIAFCEKLKLVPYQLLRSTTLMELVIVYCPILKERFRKEMGEDWSKISHIPNIDIE